VSALLELDHVGKRYGHGTGERVVLHDLTLELYAGELMAIWGRRGSGRSTLLRLAAGLQAPSTGVVRFAGHDLARRDGSDLGAGIGFCQPAFRGGEDALVIERLMVGQLARGVAPKVARARTWDALARAGVRDCASCRVADLPAGESVRVSIARALALQPALLLIDEPTNGVDLLERDEILLLLRSLADEGLAVLTATGESTALSGADRALSLSDGELRGVLTPALAEVLPLPRRARA